jgi:hypothetical protein
MLGKYSMLSYIPYPISPSVYTSDDGREYHVSGSLGLHGEYEILFLYTL